jgi:sialate O-acetylesterase
MKNQYNENRRYLIPKGILKAGKNVISVRVEDTGGGGGIYGEPAQMKLTIGDNVQSLAGDWSFRIDKIFESSAAGIGPNSYPRLLFNAMVNQLIPYAFRGVI